MDIHFLENKKKRNNFAELSFRNMQNEIGKKS